MPARKPTSQQVAQGKARAGGNNPIKVTDAGLKKLGKVAVTAATMLPAGRAVKAASTVAKAASEGRAIARALKAANKDVGIKYKKGYNKDNYSGRNETKPKQVAKEKTRVNNPNAKLTQPSSYKDAKSAFNAWVKKNPEGGKAVSAAIQSAKVNKNTALANSAKGKTQTPTAEAARRRNINR